MNIGGKRFAVDREHGKIAGVCAGIANHTGLDPTIIRIAFVLAALATKFWVVLIAYGVLAAVGGERRPGGRFASVRGDHSSQLRREEVRDRMRSMDRRMQEIETYVTSSNSQLAREIEELR